MTHCTGNSRVRLIELARRYSRPGPRYTSYPPANHFIGIENVPEFMLPISESCAPLSIYVHIPFCKSLCWYCGCNTVITKDSLKAETYLNTLAKEIKLYLKCLQPERSVVQVHLGGGTPNFLSPNQVEHLNRLLRDAFNFSDDAEISVELDPRTLDEAKVEAFRAAGFNRASFGVQDCDPAVQEAIHRIQPHAFNERAMMWLRGAGMRSLNIDLIYGLPRQSPQSFAETIAAAVALKPDRLTLFSYAHVPWMKPAQRNLEKYGLPDAEAKLMLFTQAVTQLQAAGYVYVGMDHFARADDELVRAQENGTLQRNFQGYSTHGGCEILGLGVSSISQSTNSYSQNVKDLQAYSARIDAGQFPIERGYVLNPEDKLRRSLIMQIMCNLRLEYSRESERLGVDIRSHFAREIDSLGEFEADGLLQRSDSEIRLTDTGRFFIRNIAMVFDQYLQPNEQRYSKTV